MDKRDPRVARLERRVQLERGTIEHDPAGVRPDRARHDLEQRRFSGSVFTQQGVDFAAGDGETYVA
jgi:hypothetical protein